MEPFKEFILRNFKMLSVMLSFIVTIYIQHVGNIARINELTVRCDNLELRIKNQYEKIDAIKLDKAVFEATMTQLALMQSDLREMRGDIRELLMMQKWYVVLFSVPHSSYPQGRRRRIASSKP